MAFGGTSPPTRSSATTARGSAQFQSVYFRHANGTIESIAHQGTPIPQSAGGGWYDVAFGPGVNNKGQVAFTGVISPIKPTGDPATDDPSKDADGVFLYWHGQTVAVARPGTVVPGGATSSARRSSRPRCT